MNTNAKNINRRDAQERIKFYNLTDENMMRYIEHAEKVWVRVDVISYGYNLWSVRVVGSHMNKNNRQVKAEQFFEGKPSEAQIEAVVEHVKAKNNIAYQQYLEWDAEMAKRLAR